MKASRLKLLVLVLCGLLPTLLGARAADIPGISELFRSHYHGSFYRENRCSDNIQSLIRLALKSGTDLEGASLIYLTNVGTWNFGLVAGYNARGQGRYAEGSSGPRLPGHANWGFHVFLLADGKVFDFDFGQNPKVLPLHDYVREMFHDYKDTAGLRERRLDDYRAAVYRIKPGHPGAAELMSRSDFLEPPVDFALRELLLQRER